MELRHLRYFVAVAEELNFTKAAEKLHLAQPSITRQIRDLEEEIGVRMFDRSKHRISLTKEGHLFFVSAQSLLEECARSILAVQRLARGEPEELHIGYMSNVFYDILHSTLKTFRKEHPQTIINLIDMKPAEQCRAIEQRRIDAGFMSLQPWTMAHSLARTCVAQEPVVVALPTSHAMARKRKIELKHLSSIHLITLSEKEYPGTRRWLMDICQKANFIPAIHQEAECEPAVLNLVAGGTGIALLPRPVEKIPHKGVTFRPLRPSIAVDFYIAWRVDNQSHALKEYLAVVHSP